MADHAGLCPRERTRGSVGPVVAWPAVSGGRPVQRAGTVIARIVNGVGPLIVVLQILRESGGIRCKTRFAESSRGSEAPSVYWVSHSRPNAPLAPLNEDERVK